MKLWHQQWSYGVRLDWGLSGAAVVAEQADVAVVVDVLSFTTTLSVALDAGTAVLPYRWNDGTAADFARRHGAALPSAAPRPVRARSACHQSRFVPGQRRSGSYCPHRTARRSHTTWARPAGVCLGASLRNAAAVARWVAATYHHRSTTVAVIAAGEHWPQGGLRPAVEDLWGAGAVVAHLADAGWSRLSPEACAARASWAAVAEDVLGALLASVSGRELVAQGFPADVQIAAEVGASHAVPLLRNQHFEPAPGTGSSQ